VEIPREGEVQAYATGEKEHEEEEQTELQTAFAGIVT
jgi:hypothetical protein